MKQWLPYLLPGLVFQSAVIAGGYATGAEVLTFFMRHGLRAGAVAMLVPVILWSTIAAICFRLVRDQSSGDGADAERGPIAISGFARSLLPGPVAWLLTTAYFGFLFCILSLIVALAGKLSRDYLAFPSLGIVGMPLLFVAGSTVRWNRLQPILMSWSWVLYAAFASLLAVSVAGNIDREVLVHSEERWLSALGDGLMFSAYNAVLIPVAFRSLRRTQSSACWWAGLLAGPIAMGPGVLFFFALAPYAAELHQSGELPLSRLIRDWHLLPKLAVIVAVAGAMARSGVVLLRELIGAAALTLRGATGRNGRAHRVTLAAVIGLAVGVSAWKFRADDILNLGYRYSAWVMVLLFVAPVLYRGVRLWGNRAAVLAPQPARTGTLCSSRRSVDPEAESEKTLASNKSADEKRA